MKYIHPAAIGDAQLISSSVPETDHAAWSAGTAYTAGQRVIRTTGVHRIFERLLPGTTATAPESDPVNWLDVGPTARWAMFDKSVGTLTSSASSSITVVLDPGQICEGLALLDLDCESVVITASVGGTPVYSRTLDPVLDTTPIIDWYSYFFESIARRRTVILTDLPPYVGMQITVTIAASTGPVSCGTCVVGRVNTIGDTLLGVQLGIVDYSKKSTDDFGATTVVERGYANRMTVRASFPADTLSQVASKLKAVRAVPVVCIGEDAIESTVFYGWLKDWGIDLQLRQTYYCSLTVEGLV
jgi:hypothetical protein